MAFKGFFWEGKNRYAIWWRWLYQYSLFSLALHSLNFPELKLTTLPTRVIGQNHQTSWLSLKNYLLWRAETLQLFIFAYLLVPWKPFQRLFYCFPAPRLAKLNHLKSVFGMWFLRHFFTPYLFHRSRKNRRDKLRGKFRSEKMFRKPHLKLLRWFSVHEINNISHFLNEFQFGNWLGLL